MSGDAPASPAPSRRLRRWALRSGALVLGLAAGLLLAEGAARVAGPIAGEDLFYGGMNPPPDGLFRRSATLIKEPTPGFSGSRLSLEGEIPIRINSLGMRGPEPSPGGSKWMAIGDSFVMGNQVREEETFVSLLSQKLGVEVLNAGCDEYSTWQETRRYLELDEKIDASVVVALLFLGNDLNDNERFSRAFADFSRRTGDEPLQELHTPFSAWLFGHSYLAAYVHVSRNRGQMLDGSNETAKKFRDELSLWSFDGTPELDKLMTSTKDALSALKAAVEGRGDQLLVAVAPPAYYVDERMMKQVLREFGVTGDGTDGPRDKVMATLAELGIAACDLTPGLRAAIDEGRKPYLRFDGHWNPVGHRIAAEEIVRCHRRQAFEAERAAAAEAPLQPAEEARIPGRRHADRQ